MEAFNSGSLVSTNVASKNRRVNTSYPTVWICSTTPGPVAVGSSERTQLPSTRTTPAIRSGASWVHSSTTRQPMLWPTRITGGRSRSASMPATALAKASMEQSASPPALRPWAGRSQVMTRCRGVRSAATPCQSDEAQAKPWTKTMGGSPDPDSSTCIVATSSGLGATARAPHFTGNPRPGAQGALMILATSTTRMISDRAVWNIMIALVGRFRTPSSVGPKVVLVKNATQK